MPITHFAFSDDSKHHCGRYNSLALITLGSSSFDSLQTGITKILDDSGIESEFKWEKLRSAKYRFTALKMVDFVFQNLGKLRVDTLIWDLEDQRHKDVVRRNDSENLARMYYHLVSTTFTKRWPVEKTQWRWHPDKQSGIDWNILRNCIENKKHKCVEDLFRINPRFQKVSLENPLPSESKEHSLIQLADLFAGMGSYSWGHYDKYEQWRISNSKQQTLFKRAMLSFPFSPTELERFQVIEYFNSESKKRKLNIGFRSARGFKSYDPRVFINFWPYQPQSVLDKAPRR